jgi:glycolate oxidase iron-sulfur subunit
MKDYGHLLADDPEWAERAAAFSASVRDVHEVLADLLADGPRAPRHPVRARVAYHDACHLGHAQGVRAQPRAVLRSIPGLEVVDIPEAALCCGSAGIYNMVAPTPAAELGARKAANIRSVQPDMVVTGNPGCLLQIGKHLNAAAEPADSHGNGALDEMTPDTRTLDGTGLPLLHPVQLLDASIRGVSVPRS